MTAVKIYKNLNISKRLKKSRQLKNMSQAELAAELNVSAAAISQYESGEKKPSIANFLKLAKILEVSTDYLLGDDVQEPQTVYELFRGLDKLSPADQKKILSELKSYYQYLKEKMGSH